MNLFHNWSDEDLKMTWDGKPFTFKAGSVHRDTIKDAGGEITILTPSIIDTFARHLADREMDKEGVDPRRRMRDDALYEDYIARAKTEAKTESEPVEVVETTVESDDGFECDECDKVAKSKAGLAAHKRSHKSDEII